MGLRGIAARSIRLRWAVAVGLLVAWVPAGRVEVSAAPAWAAPAKGRFLVASPTLMDRNFSRTVVLLVEHGPKGSMGLVINRTSSIRLSEAVPWLSDAARGDEEVFVGGPVGSHSLHMLLRTDDDPGESEHVFDDVWLTRSREVVRRVARDADRTTSFRVFAGYAGWGAGQLDREIARGDWRVLRANAGSVFYDEDRLWDRLIPPNPRNSARNGVRSHISTSPPLTAPGFTLQHRNSTFGSNVEM